MHHRGGQKISQDRYAVILDLKDGGTRPSQEEEVVEMQVQKPPEFGFLLRNVTIYIYAQGSRWGERETGRVSWKILSYIKALELWCSCRRATGLRGNAKSLMEQFEGGKCGSFHG